MQTSRTPSVAKRVKATGLFLLKFKRGKLIGSPWSQRQCKRVRGSATPPHTHTGVFALILIAYVTTRKAWPYYSQELKKTSGRQECLGSACVQAVGTGLTPASAGRPARTLTRQRLPESSLLSPVTDKTIITRLFQNMKSRVWKAP